MIFDTKNCAGCRTCEIACSYHHRNIFAPSIASIKIINKPEEQASTICIYEQDNGNHIACDGCKNLDEPLCVKYCPSITVCKGEIYEGNHCVCLVML